MSLKKRVLIVDDHPVFREGLKSLVDRSANYQVIGEASSGEEAIALIPDVKPELITLDITLPDMNGVETARIVAERFPDVRILMLSMHQKFEYVADSLRAGARGYMVKDAAGGKLIDALDAICVGDSCSPHPTGRRTYWTKSTACCRRANSRSCAWWSRVRPPAKSPRISTSARRPLKTIVVT